MSTQLPRLSVRFALVVFAVSSAAWAGEPSQSDNVGTDVLNIQINVPTTWLILGDDKMNEVLHDKMRQRLFQAGCRYAVNFLGLADNPADARYLLTIDLNEWRLDSMGNAHCSLTASLKTPKETHSFGNYSSSTTRWSSERPPFRLSSAFEDAAEDGIERLSADIAQSGLLAGLHS